MRRISAVALTTIFFLNSVNVGFAQEECIKCTQNYVYICMQNYGECMNACSTIGTTDRNACQRRCIASDSRCNTRAALKCGTCTPKHFSIPPPARIQELTDTSRSDCGRHTHSPR